VLASAGTPAAIVGRLSEEMRKSLASPQTQEPMKALGAVTVADTPAEFAAFLKKGPRASGARHQGLGSEGAMTTNRAWQNRGGHFCRDGG
jgi:tripartite-type tricarboxylate transporter receptor subunit TctC